MSAGLAGVPAGRPRDAELARDRGGAFALPVSTSFRFALLIAAVVASSFLTYESIYLATGRHRVALNPPSLFCGSWPPPWTPMYG